MPDVLHQLSLTLQSHVIVDLPFASRAMCRDFENVLLRDLVTVLDHQEHCMVERSFFSLHDATAAKGKFFFRIDKMEYQAF